MKVTVLGASGGCGRWVVELALERGHDVTAVVRPTSAAPPDGAEVIRGEVTDLEFVRSLPLGDVTFCCVGQRRRSLFPWSRLLSPPDLVQTVARHLVAARPKRLVWISAGGVGTSRERLRFPITLMVRAGRVGTGYADLEVAESILEGAAFPTTAVRPVTLTNGTAPQPVGAVERFGLTSTVHRRSVAAWMLDHAEAGTRSVPPALLGTSRAHRSMALPGG